MARCVLLADPDPDSRSIHRAMLAHRGYAVLEAGDRDSAVGVSVRCRPDVVLAELTLPAPDLRPLPRLLRESPATAHIPVVALSALALPQFAAEALCRGYASFATKPLDPETLGAVIEQALARPGPAYDPPGG